MCLTEAETFFFLTVVQLVDGLQRKKEQRGVLRRKKESIIKVDSVFSTNMVMLLQYHGPTTRVSTERHHTYLYKD